MSEVFKNNTIFVELKYDVGKDKFEINTNANNVKSVIENFLRSQIGKGKDDREANRIDVYTINIHLDLTDDSFFVSHDCGNEGLREGILMHFLNKEKVKHED